MYLVIDTQKAGSEQRSCKEKSAEEESNIVLSNLKSLNLLEKAIYLYTCITVALNFTAQLVISVVKNDS